MESDQQLHAKRRVCAASELLTWPPGRSCCGSDSRAVPIGGQPLLPLANGEPLNGAKKARSFARLLARSLLLLLLRMSRAGSGD